MSKFRRHLATIPILILSGPASAQSEPASEVWEGITSSMRPWVIGAFETAIEGGRSLAAEYEEHTRLYWLANSDIEMWIKSHDAGTGSADSSGIVPEVRVGRHDLFVYSQEAADSSIYAKFDWQNLKMSMRAKNDESSGYLEFLPTGSRLNTDSEETDITMYFDAAGDVYVPIPSKDNLGEAQPMFVRANLAEAMAGLFGFLELSIDLAIEFRAAEMMDALGPQLAVMIGNTRLAGLVPEEGPIRNLLVEYAEEADRQALQQGSLDPDSQGALESRLNDILLQLAWTRYEALATFPLVNFVVVFSPAAVRAEAESRGIGIREEPTTWRGIEGATRITITEGEDEGYVMIFDRYNRLVLLRDTDGSTARYAYDRNLTVSFPPGSRLFNFEQLIPYN